MRQILKRIKDESAGAMIENIIVLPLVIVVILSLMVTSFIMHDRSTVEAAAKRGAIYAANCVSNPNYATIVGQTGDLDVDPDKTSFDFKSLGTNVNAYRAILGGDDIASDVIAQVEKIVEKTRIHWLPQDSVEVSYSQKNMFLYQDIVVTVDAVYDIPDAFALFGLETEFRYTATAKTRTTDPDEFIRNADLIVDIITDVDKKTGGHLNKATDKITELATKVLDWLP